MTFVINSFFDPDVQELIQNPALQDWPVYIEDYTDDQLIEMLTRRDQLEEIKKWLLKNIDDNNPKKEQYLLEVERAIAKISIIMVPDTYKTDQNKWAEETAKDYPPLPLREALKTYFPEPPLEFGDLVFYHRATYTLENELRKLDLLEASNTDDLRYIDEKQATILNRLQNIQRAIKTSTNNAINQDRNKHEDTKTSEKKLLELEETGEMLPPKNAGDLARLIIYLNNTVYFSEHSKYPTNIELWELAKEYSGKREVTYDQQEKRFEWGNGNKTTQTRFNQACKGHRKRAADVHYETIQNNIRQSKTKL